MFLPTTHTHGFMYMYAFIYLLRFKYVYSSILFTFFAEQQPD